MVEQRAFEMPPRFTYAVHDNLTMRFGKTPHGFVCRKLTHASAEDKLIYVPNQGLHKTWCLL
jgi:hypothetical protein